MSNLRNEYKLFFDLKDLFDSYKRSIKYPNCENTQEEKRITEIYNKHLTEYLKTKFVEKGEL